MKQNKAMYRVTLWPQIIFIIVSFISLFIGIIVGSIVPESIGIPVCLSIFILPAMSLLVPYLTIMIIWAIQERSKGKILTPNSYEIIGHGIRTKIKGFDFDIFYSWWDFSEIGYMKYLGIVRFTPIKKKVDLPDGKELFVRELWISLSRDEYQSILNNMK